MKVFKIVILITILLFIAGCNQDTRVIVKPKPNLDKVNLTEEQKQIYRLHIMKELYNRKVLRDFENEKNQTYSGLDR